jgi:hypothetical protein
MAIIQVSLWEHLIIFLSIKLEFKVNKILPYTAAH